MKVRTYHAATPPGERWQHSAHGFVVELGGAEFEIRQVDVEARGQVAIEITARATRFNNAEIKVAPVESNRVRVEVHYDNLDGTAEFECEHCGAERWVGWAAQPGGARKAQCVPCGHVQDLPESERTCPRCLEPSHGHARVCYPPESEVPA